MTIIWIILALTVGLFSLSLLLRSGKRKLMKPLSKLKAPVPSLTACPICKSPLAGAKLISAMITYPDKRIVVRIKGCPRCTKGDAVSKRTCPSCGSKLGVLEPVVADYKASNGTIRVVIKGCKQCYGSV